MPRLLNYCSFTITSFLLGTFRVGRPDVIGGFSPTIPGLSAIPMKWILRAKLVFNVADLFPEAAVAFGVITESLGHQGGDRARKDNLSPFRSHHRFHA